MITNLRLNCYKLFRLNSRYKLIELDINKLGEYVERFFRCLGPSGIIHFTIHFLNASVFHQHCLFQGTIFLFIYWPSFNSYGADEVTQRRAVVNTVYALAASCVATFAFSVLSSTDSKLNMVSFG